MPANYMYISVNLRWFF